VSKFAFVTLTAVTLSLSSNAATAGAMHHSNMQSRAVAIQSSSQISAETVQTIENHGEPLSLILLGSLFVGSAMFFSTRRSNA
jgi:hypothetical protein